MVGVGLKGGGASRELKFHVILSKQLHKEVGVAASALLGLIRA